MHKNPKKLKIISLVPLFLVAALVFSTTAYAADLPIDISAVGRQPVGLNHPTARIGANLFNADSQRVNELLAEQIRNRQASTNYLFAAVPTNDEVNPHLHMINTAEEMALFNQPVFLNFNMPEYEEPIPMWVTVSILAVCAGIGFIWALVSMSKKSAKRKEDKGFVH